MLELIRTTASKLTANFFSMNHLKCRLSKIEHFDGRPVGDGSGGPITVGYTVEGYAAGFPEIGKPFSIFRTKRNGVETEGIFTTSDVQDFTAESMIETRNSKYKFEVLS